MSKDDQEETAAMTMANKKSNYIKYNINNNTHIQPPARPPSQCKSIEGKNGAGGLLEPEAKGADVVSCAAETSAREVGQPNESAEGSERAEYGEQEKEGENEEEEEKMKQVSDSKQPASKRQAEDCESRPPVGVACCEASAEREPQEAVAISHTTNHEQQQQFQEAKQATGPHQRPIKKQQALGYQTLGSSSAHTQPAGGPESFAAGQQVPVSADYLAQLIKDKKQLSVFPAVFMHLQRLLDDEINKVRQSLFQLNDVVHLDRPLELPEPEGEFVQLQEKLYVPVGEHPEYNFVGRLLGPRGMTAKQLEQETGCKIMIRGRGSMRDKKKEEQNRGKTNWEHLNDNLHVLITVEDTQNRAQIKLSRALEEVKQLLVPIVDGEDELKKRQLMELAIINGTYRDCNYNETLSKMLNETGQQQAQLQQPEVSLQPNQSQSHNQPQQQQQVAHYHQPHQQGGGQQVANPSTTAVMVAAAAAAAAAAAHHNPHGMTHHGLPAGPPSGLASPMHPASILPPGTPLQHHHAQSSAQLMAARSPANQAAAEAAALLYAQQYHDFQHYVALAAASGQPPLMHASEYHTHHHAHALQHHPQAPPVPVSAPTPPQAAHHPAASAAAAAQAVAQAVAAAATSQQQQQPQQYHQQPLRSDHHHLAAAAAAAALAYQQQIHHHQLLHEHQQTLLAGPPKQPGELENENGNEQLECEQLEHQQQQQLLEPSMSLEGQPPQQLELAAELPAQDLYGQ